MEKLQNNAKKNAVGEILINEQNLQDKIYEIRGEKVMLDFDLAKIYGYTTKAFNQQVMRNIEKFEEDFRFRLTQKELDTVLILSSGSSDNLRSQFVTSSWGGARYLPHAFTEQGIYMLMTVLHGELAVKQSKTLIRLFKSMKDYIVENHAALEYQNNLKMLTQVAENTKDVAEVKVELEKVKDEVEQIEKGMSEVVMRSEISPVLLDFAKVAERREFLIFDGEPAKADETYMKIYEQAKENIYIIDNYINLKSLRLLRNIKPRTKITVFSDNPSNSLYKSDLADFTREFPNLKVNLKKTCGKVHDRFIILDYKLESEKMFQCGASSKDAGKSVTMVHELSDKLTREGMRLVIDALINNPELSLK